MTIDLQAIVGVLKQFKFYKKSKFYSVNQQKLRFFVNQENTLSIAATSAMSTDYNSSFFKRNNISQHQ
ncbi:hypothetical protein ACDT20_13860, partial [Staphylococcus aureus]